MKKLLFLAGLVLIGLVLVGFVSCEGPPGARGEKGERGPAGQDGRDGGGTHIMIIDVPVERADWNWDNTERYYSYTANVNHDLDQYIYDFGSVEVYLDFGFSQQVLPITRHFQEGRTTTTDCEFGVGEIRFYVTNSDFAQERPGDMLFRVVIKWEEGF